MSNVPSPHGATPDSAPDSQARPDRRHRRAVTSAERNPRTDVAQHMTRHRLEPFHRALFGSVPRNKMGQAGGYQHLPRQLGESIGETGVVTMFTAIVLASAAVAGIQVATAAPAAVATPVAQPTPVASTAGLRPGLVIQPYVPAAQAVPPERLFAANCAACHQRNGRGIPQAFPALDGNALVQGEPRALVAVVLNGRGGMPAFRNEMDDAQIAAVLTYVRGAWGNRAGPMPPSLVAESRGAEVPPEADRNLQAH